MRESIEKIFFEGVALFEKARLDEAEAAFQQVVEANAGFQIKGANAYRYLGNIRKLQRRFREAVDYFSKALDVSPGSEDVLLSRGSLLIESREYHAALKDFQAVLDMPPGERRVEMAVLYYVIAEIYLKMETYAEALRHAEEALRMKPDNNTFKILLAEIRAIMKKASSNV